ncbi:MAG: hypothetical protein R2806_19500 [Saprospiraceae bacterium]
MFLKESTKRSWGVLPDSLVDDPQLYLDEIRIIRQYECQFENELPDDVPESIELHAYLGLAGAIILRVLGFRLYDEQYQGALALIRGHFIEMQTGEGKTVTAALAAAWLARTLGSTCIVTFNEYLAQRDAQWMQPIYARLGIQVAAVCELDPAEIKHRNYQVPIIYTTIKVVGFDFLRNQMAWTQEEQFPLDFRSIIIDEADAILIDDARHPLVLAGSQIQPVVDLKDVASLVCGFEEDNDFQVDARKYEVYLTGPGLQKAEAYFPDVPLYSAEGQETLTAIHVALQARMLLHKNIHYVIKDQRVCLVDEFTGRVVPDRQWRNGLQAAVEAKENLPVRADGSVLQMISITHLMQKFDHLAGMSATLYPVADELNTLYGVKTCIIPTHQPSRRKDLPDLAFARKEDKIKAIVSEVKVRNRSGQPVLIGTLTVEESEMLAKQLIAAGFNPQVLNARHDREEAEIVAKAAMPGAVTIATNMAGRGTDIRLGNEYPESRNAVVLSGGLFILGTNFHESRRIDRQLRGRAGRQGDPGETRFIVSAEDELMVRYHLHEMVPPKWRRRDWNEFPPEKLLEFMRMVQAIIENRLEDMRRNIAEYADFLEKQRIIWYRERHQYLEKQLLLEAYIREVAGWERPRVLLHRNELLAIILQQYDLFWAQFLQAMLLRRDGIHLVRLGGYQPLRTFRKEADALFESSLDACRLSIREHCKRFCANPELSLDDLDVRRPSTTWTYIASDNPFASQLELRLANSGEIAMQTDLLTMPVLFFKGLYNRLRKR